MTRTRANIVLLLAGAIWGMGFVAQSTAMQAIGPFLFIGLRFATATLAILPFALREASRSISPLVARDWWQFVLIGILLFAEIAFQQFGLLTTSVTNSGFLTGLYVVMVPILCVALFREWPHRVVWPAVAIAFAGIWLLSGSGVSGLSTGDWLTITGAALIALQLIFIARYVGQSGRPVTLAVAQFAICAVLGLLFAVVFEPIDLAAIEKALPEILYAGIFSGGIAFTLQIIGQQYTTASQAALFLSSEAVFAALFAAIILDERLAATGFAGCVLIFAAILIVEIVPGLKRRSPAAS